MKSGSHQQRLALPSAYFRINMFPDWFLPPQADWPATVEQVGFPLPLPCDTPELPPNLEEFLDAGPPPLVFSHTSGLAAVETFFRAAIPLAQRLGRRAIILAADTVSLPKPLPDGFLRLPFAAHSRLYPRAAAAIHHGGVQSAAAAFAAGVPQLIVPAMYDHPEVARRVKALGGGDFLPCRQFSAARAAPLLDRLLNSDAVRRRCREIATLSSAMNCYPDATRLLQALAPEYHTRRRAALSSAC